MEAQSAWDTLVEASRYMFRGPSREEILVFFLVLGTLLLVVSIPYLWSKIYRLKEVEGIFRSRGRSLGLTEDEIELLWRYVKALPYDPQMVYDNKALFERVVSKIVRSNLAGVRLIPSIRTKLRFDTVPWFMPLNTTRDIDVYQTGKLIVDDAYVDAAVWDKTETELHIVVLEALPRPIRVGEMVKFHFIRESEGRYSFESPVKDKYMDGDRLVLVLEHSETLHRVQLRESLRWRVNIPVEFALIGDVVVTEEEGLEFLSGIIEDISTKGVRVCTETFVSPKEGDYVMLNFSIGEHRFDNLLGQIVNVRQMPGRTCMGVKFLKVSRQEETVIDRFIVEEQRKLIRSYRMGETG